MKILGNIVWLIFGGFGIAVEYFISSLLLMITIIGIPFGIATMRLGILALWPFGSHIVDKPQDSGCLNMIMNVLWFFVGGFWIALTHLGFGLLLGKNDNSICFSWPIPPAPAFTHYGYSGCNAAVVLSSECTTKHKTEQYGKRKFEGDISCRRLLLGY